MATFVGKTNFVHVLIPCIQNPENGRAMLGASWIYYLQTLLYLHYDPESRVLPGNRTRVKLLSEMRCARAVDPRSQHREARDRGGLFIKLLNIRIMTLNGQETPNLEKKLS